VFVCRGGGWATLLQSAKNKLEVNSMIYGSSQGTFIPKWMLMREFC